MANQYKIPQKLDIEEKIIGPFTLRQFFYMIGGGILVYALFNIFGKTNLTVFLLSALPIAVITVVLVFVRVNERSFEFFLFSLFAFLKNPRALRWKKSARMINFEMMAKTSEDEQAKQKEMKRLAKKGIVQSQLSELASILDSRGWNRENAGDVLGDRVVSSDEARSIVNKNTFVDDVEDVFSDLDQAFDSMREKAVDQEIERDFGRI